MEHDVIDDCTYESIATLVRKLEKARRRNADITDATLLCCAYRYYVLAMRYRMCTLDEMPDHFRSDTDEWTDESIRNYESYRHMKALLCPAHGYDDGDVDSFCKMAYHTPDVCGLEDFSMYVSHQYALAMLVIYTYLRGRMGRKDMEARLQLLFSSHGSIRGMTFQVARALYALKAIGRKRKERKERQKTKE